MNIRIWGPILAGVAALLPVAALSIDRPQVTRFTPEGRAEDIRQVTARFSMAMVRFGDPSARDPFAIDCAAKGKGRWADSRTWVYDFDAPVPGGMRCRFNARPDLAAVDGQSLAGRSSFTFDSGGPSVRSILPRQGDEVEEDQTFLVAVNGTADIESVKSLAACTVDGVGEAIPVDILPTATRDALVARLGERWPMRSFLYDAGINELAATPAARNAQLASVVALKCRRPLPAGRDMSILWPAGIRTATGFTAGRDRRFGYSVRAPFTARVECRRVNPAAGCNPVEGLNVNFSAAVPRELAERIRLVTPTGSLKPDFSDVKSNSVDSVSFPAPLPENATLKVELPTDIKDQSGRALANADRFPLDVRVDPAPPLVKFAAGFGVLEAKEGGVLPVTVRNVEPALAGRVTAVTGQTLNASGSDAEVAAWLRRLDKAEDRDVEEVKHGDDTRLVNNTRSTPLIEGSAGQPLKVDLPAKGKGFEVVGIPLKTPGFHIVELASPTLGKALLGRDAPRYVAAGALVTDMSVHFKWGRAASLVWVTRLSDGRPVAGADIAISDSCTGRRLAGGRTDQSGRLSVPGGLPEPETYGSCDYDDHPLMVSARAGGDFSFTLTSWGNGITPSDFDLPFGWTAPRPIIHTIFDRTLIRAGETVEMKHVMRLPVAAGFTRPAQPLSGMLTITHLGAGGEFQVPFTIGRDGIGESRWAAPRDARLGDYVLTFKAGETTYYSDARFRVDEYRLPTMTASVQGPGRVLINPADVPVDLYAGYLSGGGAGGMAVKLRAVVEQRGGSVAGYENFTFGGDRIVEGSRPLDGSGTAEANTAGQRVRVIPATLGAAGGARIAVPGPFKVDVPSNLVVEMDYQDASGEVLTASSRIPIDPAAVKLGIRTDGWLMKDDDLRLQIVALDSDNKPVRGQRVEVALYSREILSARRRLIGGFYAYDNAERTTKIKASCNGISDAQGLVSCTIDPGVSGEVEVQATTTDKAGNVARANRSVWLVGTDDWWFGGDNGDRMDLIPERTDYAPGDTARLQVRMPFRSATALVTVEREGVVSSFVTTLTGTNPVVEVPMTGAYAPNVYVSVMAVRGRIAGWRLWLAQLARDWNLPFFSRDGARPTALVDLAKPSYRIGMTRLKVGWDTHRLAVTVKPAAETYRVRQTVDVALAVAAPKGRALPADAEVTVAAVDEALLQLQPNDSWSLLDAMMGQRDLSVLTSTAQMQVVGKRHYGRKAVAAGGGGGLGFAGVTRENFQPLLLWRGRVKLDAQGRAAVKVPLSDALSAFRIVAVATAGDDLFGTGQATVRTVQDLQIFAGAPPVVRDGDRYQAVFTLRNGTEQSMTVTATPAVAPAVMTGPPITVTIPAGSTRPVYWNAIGPKGVDQLAWTVTARTADGKASDQVRIVQTVVPAVPDAVIQSSLMRVDGSLDLPVARPANALPGRGGIEVALSPSLTAVLAGVERYMAVYPYTCIEQLASRAIVSGSATEWDGVMARLPLHLDRDGLARYFPTDALEGSPGLTAYLLSIAAEAGNELPAAARTRMIAGLTAFVDGRLERPEWVVGNAVVARTAAIAALARQGAANAGMIDGIGDWDARDLPTTALIDQIVILRRMTGIPNAGQRLATAEQVLRGRFDTQGTTLAFTPRPNERDAYSVVSNDENAVRAVLAVLDRPAWRDDAPLMLRGAIQRQRQARWDTTTANAWGAIAVRRFAASFETAAVTGSTSALLGNARRAIRFAGADAPAPVTLPWPAGPGSLALRHEGNGAPWAVVTSRAAVPLAKPMTSGYRIAREVTPVEQKVKDRLTRGDVVRVRLTIEAGAERAWVVVNDPIPAGASIVGDLGGQSALLAGQGGSDGTATPSFIERRQDSFQAFYAFAPAGRFTVDYLLRLNGAGTFHLPPTRVEAMYAPEAFAMLPNAPVTVSMR